MFNWADYAIAGVITLSVLISIIRGFVREAISLATWIAAFWVAFTYSHQFSSILEHTIKSEAIRFFATFGVLFITTLILGAVVNYIIGQLVDGTGLSGTDRLLGILFGAARGVLLISVILMAAKMTPASQESWWKDALLIPHFEPIQQWLSDMMPESVKSHFVLKPQAEEQPSANEPVSSN